MFGAAGVYGSNGSQAGRAVESRSCVVMSVTSHVSAQELVDFLTTYYRMSVRPFVFSVPTRQVEASGFALTSFSCSPPLPAPLHCELLSPAGHLGNRTQPCFFDAFRSKGQQSPGFRRVAASISVIVLGEECGDYPE